MGWRGWAGRVDAAAYLSLVRACTCRISCCASHRRRFAFVAVCCQVVSIVNSIGPAPAYNVRATSHTEACVQAAVSALTWYGVACLCLPVLLPPAVLQVAIPLFAIVATYTRQGKQVLALIVALFLSIITDVIWALFNHGDLRSLLYFRCDSTPCDAANMRSRGVWHPACCVWERTY